MSDSSAITYRPLRAPPTDGDALLDPAWEELCQLASQCYTLPTELNGLAQAAREAILTTAKAYTAQYRDVSFAQPFTGNSRLVLSGHQPGLFHPGVWLKNFALSAVTLQTGSLGINLVVDNDTVRTAEIRVPSHLPSNPNQPTGPPQADQSLHDRVRAVPFDAAGAEIPYEERTVLDPPLFHTFAERVTAILSPLRWGTPPVSGTPLVTRIWHEVLAAYNRRKRETNRAPNLGLTLAEGRHRLEEKLGLQTLEVPLSLVCQTVPFRQFTVLLFTQLAHFHQVFNELLANYRQVNHIRSTAHPFPDLAAEGEWLEAPFWIWTTQAPRRQRLFIRNSPSGLEFTHREGVHFKIASPNAGEGQNGTSIEQLVYQEQQGIKIRPRAIVTTLFARLFCSDLFLHGIGGAKYDELTDALMRRFFHLQPPRYGTLTATVRLPIDRPSTTPADLQQCNRLLRDLNFAGEKIAAQPQWFSLLGPEAQQTLQEVAQQKHRLVERGWPKGAKAAWHQQLSLINEQLAELLTPVRQHRQKQRTELADSLQQARLLGSREFSLVLFPAETLPGLLLDFCRPRL